MFQVVQGISNRHVEISARPIRYAYIIGAEPAKKDIIDIITNCCESFGGCRNIIIPSNGLVLEDWWISFLVAGDPDVVLLCGRFHDIEAIKSQIYKADIQPFKIKVWRGELARTERVVKYSPIPMNKVYRAKVTEATQYGVGNKPNVIVAPRRGQRIDLLDYFEYGTLSSNQMREFKDLIEFINCNKAPRTITQPISDPTQISLENIVHAGFEYWENCYRENILGPYVLVTGDRNSLDDCCLFWNWRALAYSENFVGWVEEEEYNDIYQGNLFNQAVNNLPAYSKLLTSVSMGPSNSRAVIRTFTRIPEYSEKATKIGFAYKHASEYDRDLASVRYFCLRDYLPLVGQGSVSISRIIPQPFSYEDCLFKDLVYDLEVKSNNEEEKRGILVSQRCSAKAVLAIGREGATPDVRIGRSYFTVLLPALMSTGSTSLSFKSDWEIISNICKGRGVTLNESASGKYIRRAIELAGRVEELAEYYKNSVARQMLDAFLTRHTKRVNLTGRRREIYRRSFSVDDLSNTVLGSTETTSGYQKRKTINEVSRLIGVWWGRGMLMSGFELKCPECNFETWYPIDMVGDTYKCWRCQLVNRRPHDSKVHHRLQESFYQAHFENMIVPILTLDYIKRHVAEHSFLYSVPVYVEPDRPTSSEIDIIAIVDGEVIIAECKIANKLKNEIFKKYGDVAKKIMAHRVVFSTIERGNTCMNKDCRECIKAGVNYSDEIFTHGVPDEPDQWGTREKIADFRERMQENGIIVTTLCAADLGVV